uniref:Uncharacterized protein n=1 Tax=Anguilla anguilla TaxID=7936 RepID=A0A0E9SUZ0_ANGAN
MSGRQVSRSGNPSLTKPTSQMCRGRCGGWMGCVHVVIGMDLSVFFFVV